MIMFAQFEEGGSLSEIQKLLAETCDNTESNNEYYYH